MVAEEIVSKVEERFGCSCSEKEIRYRTYTNGQRAFYRQCMACGEWEGPIKKAEISAVDQKMALPADEKLREERQAARWQYDRQLREEARQREHQEWLSDHNEYMKSEKWLKKREKVLQRDGGICQACLHRKATQVHHLSYAHWKNEPLFELTSVCDVCHQFITLLDRKRRAA